MNRRQFFLLMCLVISAGGAPPAYSETYYVWKDRGNDGNAGDSWDNAWKTLIHAGKRAVAGDTVIVRKSAEPYRYLRVENSGTRADPIIFRGESANEPPVIAGAERVTRWAASGVNGVWRTEAKHAVHMLVEDGEAVLKASSNACADGGWFWKDGVLFYRPTKGLPDSHIVWRQSTGGSISIKENSWITVENLSCWISGGACVSINGGHHNTVRNIRAKWCWRGVDITNEAHYNLIEGAQVTENWEGIYVRLGSSFNVVRKCTVLRNGNPPLYTSRDRHAIGLGERGDTRGNIIEECEVAYNGGPPDNVAVIAFRAPESVFRNNYVHDNYGSGIFITLDSHGSVVSGNKVTRNGVAAVTAGIPGISAVAVRNSKQVSVIGNRIEDNHVSRDNIYPNVYKGPHGALDIDSAVQAWKTDMSGLRIENNVVTGTVGGPDVHISRNPDLSGIVIIPPEHGPWWLRNSAPQIKKH
jgi:parallel beta-helix repeat protein